MTAEPSPAAPPEELNGFLVVHAALRKGGRDLLAATDRFGQHGSDPTVLVKLWGFYSRGLRQHHQGEDRVIYPLVTRRQPDFAGQTSPQLSHSRIGRKYIQGLSGRGMTQGPSHRP